MSSADSKWAVPDMQQIQVVLDVQNGTLVGALATAAEHGLSAFLSTNSSHLLLRGSVSAVNQLLGGSTLVYETSIKTTANDSLVMSACFVRPWCSWESASTALVVTFPPSPSLVLSAPVSVACVEGEEVSPVGVEVYDAALTALGTAEANSTNAALDVNVTMTAVAGVVRLSSCMGVDVSDTSACGVAESASFVVAGNVSAVNTAFASLVFAATVSETGELDGRVHVSAVLASDQSTQVWKNVSVEVTEAHDAPSVQILSSVVSATENIPVSLSGVVSVVDADQQSVQPVDCMTITLSCTNCSFVSTCKLPGAQTTGAGSTVRFSGDNAQVECVLDGMYYVPASTFASNDTLLVMASDS